jgi:peptidoglycan/LPS O-acetylase OafA/YrhL
MALVYRRVKRIDIHLVNVLQAGALAGLIFAIYFGGPRHTGNDVLVAAWMAALIFVLALDRGIVARIFQTRVLTRLGEWSYAIYLVQFPLIQGLRTLRQYYPPEFRTLGDYSGAVQWIEAGALLAAAIGLGALLTVAIERPIHARLRRLITAKG